MKRSVVESVAQEEATSRPARPKQGSDGAPMRLLTVGQIEAAHAGLKGRLNQWIARADADDPEYRWLRLCVVRVGRSRFVDEVRFCEKLRERIALPPAPSRRESKTKAA